MWGNYHVACQGYPAMDRESLVNYSAKCSMNHPLSDPDNPVEHFRKSFMADDAASVKELFQRFPAIKARINEPVPGTDDFLITLAKSPAMVDVLIEAGADLNAKSTWWAGGFGLLHSATPELARHAIKRGAVVDIHAAARLGMAERVKEIVLADPVSVHARGGDGQTPLHFASTVEIAAFLLDHGADIDARDIDHESTAAQYMIADRTEVARYLAGRGAATDLLLAAALGDLPLINRHLAAAPESIRIRVSEEFFPMVGGKAGGTIYQWTLGWHVSPHQVARKFGHMACLDHLMRLSPAEVRLVNACWLHNESLAKQLIEEHPGLEKTLSPSDLRQVAHVARNDDAEAVRLMLDCGWPVEVRGQHGGTPLHWAAWRGNASMVRTVLGHGPPLESEDHDYHSTPVGWAIHASENGWDQATGDYAEVLRLLFQSGAKHPEQPGGTASVRALLQAAAYTAQARRDQP